MYLRKSHLADKVHGVDYIKGIEDGTFCNRTHPYWTVKCRPLLFTREQLSKYCKPEDVVNYDSLSDREKLELGEPVFFMSSLHFQLNGTKKEYIESVQIYPIEENKSEDSTSSNQ